MPGFELVISPLLLFEIMKTIINKIIIYIIGIFTMGIIKMYCTTVLCMLDIKIYIKINKIY